MKINFITIQKTIILMILLILIPACGSDDKSRADKVNKLEMLAIKVDKPQAHPGDVIEAEALVGHPEDFSDEFHTIWLLCNPKGDSGMESCMSEDGISAAPVIDNNKFSFTIPSDVLDSNIPKPKDMYIIHIICKDTAENCMKNMDNGTGDGLDNSFKISYKTVNVINSNSPIVNHNPTIKSIYLNGTELTSNDITLKAESDNNVFKAEVTADSFDEIKDAKGNPDHETIVFAWKSTLGSIEYYYTDQKHDETIDDLDDNKFEAAKASENDTYNIYIIALDTKGGVDWKILNITNEE